jgi:preprotein translocase subunit SecE
MAAEKTSPRDNMLWAVGLLVLLAGVIGFFHFAGDVMLLVRVIGLLVALGVALAVVGQTVRGRTMFSFLRETDVERRKVVWPSLYPETFQTTLMVLVITVIVAILLFIMDSIFGFIVRRLIGAAGGS